MPHNPIAFETSREAICWATSPGPMDRPARPSTAGPALPHPSRRPSCCGSGENRRHPAGHRLRQLRLPHCHSSGLL